jgi:hypothetical protein
MQWHLRNMAMRAVSLRSIIRGLTPESIPMKDQDPTLVFLAGMLRLGR